jgi:predicted  nucleic acid-binding Zn-ribbon protein
MKLEDILELTRAGYTKEEIQALTATQTEPAKEQAQPVKPQAEPATKNAETTEKTETKETPTTDQNSKELTDKLDQILKAVQLGNLLNTTNPTPKQDTIEDILAAIVNPPAIKK